MMYVLIFLQWICVLALAPLTVGIVRKMKAQYQNREGASVLLPYWTILSLMRKEMTITRHSSWVFRVVPFAVLATAVCLALLVPSIAYGILPHATSNIFLIGAIAALGSVFLVLGGMDTSSTFGHMGSSREMTLAALVEPAFYLVLSTLGLMAGVWSLDGIVGYFAMSPWSAVVPLSGVTLLALLAVILAENARYPVDNPATHLELTMVHEAMILEYSGPYLAMLEYASAIKLTVMLALLMNLVMPFGLLNPALGLALIPVALMVFVAKLTLGGLLVATIESTIVKMRFYRMQEYMSVAAIGALIGFILVLIGHTL